MNSNWRELKVDDTVRYAGPKHWRIKSIEKLDERRVLLVGISENNQDREILALAEWCEKLQIEV